MGHEARVACMCVVVVQSPLLAFSPLSLASIAALLPSTFHALINSVVTQDAQCYVRVPSLCAGTGSFTVGVDSAGNAQKAHVGATTTNDIRSTPHFSTCLYSRSISATTLFHHTLPFRLARHRHTTFPLPPLPIRADTPRCVRCSTPASTAETAGCL